MPDNDEHWQVGRHITHAWLRPDDKWVLLLPADTEIWPAVIAERPRRIDRLLVSRPESAERTEGPVLAGAGFRRDRTEQAWRIPLDGITAGAPVSDTHRLVPVTECDLARVTALDNEVRQSVPGCEGWSGTVADLRGTLEDDEFDPDLYLVAVHRKTGAYDGLVRVWFRRPVPRLGCIGVVPAWRRTRLAPLMLATVARILRGRGIREVVAETDTTNRAAHSMTRNHGGLPLERTVEWSFGLP
ncbi:GNAT family N-acetyltransferase [Promicromonospora sp. NPDC057138]|uniref:GNAT family N-acetyltransferase n=1 Tax=Promicromonospora sp. NPDC057138 TaxID=3346031 RepID=UPI0036432341